MIKLSAFADEASESFIGQLNALKRNGLKYVDIRNIDGKNVLNFTDAEAREYKNKLDEEKIKVACIASPLCKTEVKRFDELKNDLDRIITLAHIFGTDRVRIFSFYNYTDKESVVFQCLKEAVRYATENGVMLYHENELNIYGESPAKCLKIASETGVNLIYDAANFVLSGYKVDDEMKKIIHNCDFFHVKDARYTGEIVPAGYGDGQLNLICGKKDALFTVEPHLFEFGGYGNLTERVMSKSEFVYNGQDDAFDAGVDAVINLLMKNSFISDGFGNYVAGEDRKNV